MEISAYDPNLDFESVLELHTSINWTVYASNPEHRRRGIEKNLVQQVLKRSSRVHRIVLMTDDGPAQKSFYASLGFREIKDELRGFVLFRP